jgi:hypothetical protein
MSVGICQGGGSLEPCVAGHAESCWRGRQPLRMGTGAGDGERSRGAKLWAMRCGRGTAGANGNFLKSRLMSKKGGIGLVSC